MQKYTWLGLHVGLVVNCFLCGYGLGEETTAVREEITQRPNILWISLEDISPDLGCYGDAYAITPNIDRFARQSVLFTNAFSHSGVCAPTRSGVITGMYPTTIGTQHMRANGVPPDYVRCFTACGGPDTIAATTQKRTISLQRHSRLGTITNGVRTGATDRTTRPPFFASLT